MEIHASSNVESPYCQPKLSRMTPTTVILTGILSATALAVVALIVGAIFSVPAKTIAESYDLPKEQNKKLFPRFSILIWMGLYGTLLSVHVAIVGSFTMPEKNWPMTATWVVLWLIQGGRCWLIARKQRPDTTYYKTARLVMSLSGLAAALGALALWAILA